jgi:hypothetical protein
VSGSITSLLEGKKGKKDEPIPKEAMDHFLSMARVPQTGNPQPPPSDFEQTLNKEMWRQKTRTSHKLNVAGRAAFCEENSMTEEEHLVIEYGEEWYKQP